MNYRVRKLLTQGGSFLLAALLLWLALRGVDLSTIGQALRDADYRWLVPLIGFVLLSHWLRAWRWQMLIEALPSDGDRSVREEVPVSTLFASLMIGYMVNYAAPRLGEVARTANVAARSRFGFSGLFGTVVVERILDVLTLGVAFLSVIVLFADRFGLFRTLFLDPLQQHSGLVPVLAGVVLVGLVGLVGLVVYARRARRRDDDGFWNRRVQPVLSSFSDGLMTLLRTRRRIGLVVSTVGIWACYLVMTYLPFLMLGMTETYGITLLDAWAVLLFGSIGVAIPSPGGTGSYHYIAIQVLVHLFMVERAAAATYAVLTHGAQLVLYVVVGVLALVWQGTSFRAIHQAAEARAEAQDEDAEPASSQPSR